MALLSPVLWGQVLVMLCRSKHPILPQLVSLVRTRCVQMPPGDTAWIHCLSLRRHVACRRRRRWAGVTLLPERFSIALPITA